MNILKVAKLFEGKLVLASDNLLEDLKKIMATASDLTKYYSVNDEDLNNPNSLAFKAYQIWNQAYKIWVASKNPKQKITASMISEWLNSLKKLIANYSKSFNDPAGKSKLNYLVAMVNSVQPIDIEPINDEEEEVEQTITSPSPSPVTEPEALNPKWKYVPHKW